MVSSSKISQYLEGVEFPCTKDQLVMHARQRNAPQDVIDGLTRLPDRQYFSMAGIWDGLGEVE